MMRLRYIVLMMVATLASVMVEASDAMYYDVASATSTPVEEPQFEAIESTMPLISPTPGSVQSIAPIARTLHRTARQSVREELSTFIIRSIDSTTAASRYGVYNHKILF